MKKKRAQFLKKAVVIVFLTLIVVGFMVPGFIDAFGNNNEPQIIEPRFCSADPECNLDCAGEQINVMCVQNICMQNSCDEGQIFPYTEESLSFSLEIKKDGQNIDLAARNNPQNTFVLFEGNEVTVHTYSLALAYVLERVGILADNTCLRLDGVDYCENVQLEVNGEPLDVIGSYAPLDGDKVQISINN